MILCLVLLLGAFQFIHIRQPYRQLLLVINALRMISNVNFNRFAAAVAKKRVSLGALTQGDRRSGMDGKSTLSMAHFDFDSTYGRKALGQVS